MNRCVAHGSSLQGGDLRDALSRDQMSQLQWYRRGKDVMLDVVRGAHFLHANQVVHRDIKSKVRQEGWELRSFATTCHQCGSPALPGKPAIWALLVLQWGPDTVLLF